jgi:hypothetical protein
MTQADAVIYHASELKELHGRILELRFAAEMREYKAALKVYNRKRNGRKEVKGEFVPPGRRWKREGIGYEVKRMGRTDFVPRPVKPHLILWTNGGRFGNRSYEQRGLLANGGAYNRPVNGPRVKEYAEAMERGHWRDNLIDPIAVTPDGEVINGQHRLAALGWASSPNQGGEGVKGDPRFLVLFNVPADQVALSDTSKRSAKDFMTIAGKATVAA